MTKALPDLDFSRAPFLVIWETTQACDLKCVHCRAAAKPERDASELSQDEGRRLLSDIKAMGTPIAVLSGGDPLKRPDLYDLIRHGKSEGLRMATIPAATDILTERVIGHLRDAGTDQIALSLDLPSAELHDEFRQVPGAFSKTIEAAGWVRRIGVPLQINTTISAASLPYLSAMAQLVASLGIAFWEVFFLVPLGRGAELPSLTAEQCEEAFAILYEAHRRQDFVLKVTEAPHYRRFVAQKEGSGTALAERLRRTEGPGGSMGHAPQAVNAGRGFMFVSHVGEIFPSGFLPLEAGNVRRNSVSDVYRESPLFKALRDPSRLKGICGACEFAEICGGSRSRAHALTGDPLEAEPWCVHRPENMGTQY